MTVEGRAVLDVRFQDKEGTSSVNTITMNVVLPMNGQKVATFSGIVDSNTQSPALLSTYPAGAFSLSGPYRNAAGNEVLIETLMFAVVRNNGGNTINYSDGFSSGTIEDGEAGLFLQTIEGMDDSGNWPFMYTNEGTASYTAIVYGT